MNDPYQHPNVAPRFLRSHYGYEGKDVFDFHGKFLVPMATTPSFLDPESLEFRIKFLREEVEEFAVACAEGDLRNAADALVDLVYVALGTALMMGLPWRRLWDRVQIKNMAKRRAKDDGSDSKRGSPLDVIKPPHWTPPDHTPDLGAGNWPTFDATAASKQIAQMLIERSTKDAGVIRDSTGKIVGGVTVEVRPDGTKHYTASVDPANFKTRGE